MYREPLRLRTVSEVWCWMALLVGIGSRFDCTYTHLLRGVVGFLRIICHSSEACFCSGLNCKYLIELTVIRLSYGAW